MHAYASDSDRTPALGAIAVMAVIVAIVANWLATRVDLGPAWLVSPPAVAGAFGLLHQWMERVGWKWPLVRSLGLTNTPLIEGDYEGELVSSFENTTQPVRISIDQTWSRLSVRFEVLVPQSSTSYSVASSLVNAGHGLARLTYTYRNQPKPGIADGDLHDHDGTAEVVIDCRSGELRGRYFNFRGRQGSLKLERMDESTGG